MNSGKRTPRHMLFQWHITEHCNLRCSHCYQKGKRCSDPSWDDLMVVLDQFKKFSHRSRNRAGSNSFPVHVTVTGGEPFLRADFMTLLKRLRGQAEIGSFAILTNGTMITRQIARELSYPFKIGLYRAFGGKKEDFWIGTGQTALYPGPDLAYYPSLP